MTDGMGDRPEDAHELFNGLTMHTKRRPDEPCEGEHWLNPEDKKLYRFHEGAWVRIESDFDQISDEAKAALIGSMKIMAKVAAEGLIKRIAQKIGVEPGLSAGNDDTASKFCLLYLRMREAQRRLALDILESIVDLSDATCDDLEGEFNRLIPNEDNLWRD